jgi:uncharacterized repeat protein (TIGR01451 family)
MKIISSIKKGVLKVVATTLFAAVLMATAQTSSANTGAGTTILNVVTVNYQSPGGVALVASASASVTVTLVPTAVALAAVGLTTGATPSGTAITYSFTATSQANGSDTYQLNSTAGTLVNATAPTVVFKQGATVVTSLTLASSVISDVTAANTIVVPAGTATNLVAGDIVIINGVDYLVSTVSGAGTPATANVSATTAGTITAETPVSIVLAANAAGSNTTPAFTASVPGTPSPQIGLLVAEQQAFTVDVTSSTVAPGDGTAPVDITVGGPAPGTPITTPITTTTTVQGANLTITKEVSTDGGLTFATTGSGAPLSTLTYRITISNGGAGSASSVVITDPMPAYTTYVPGSAKSSTVLGALFANIANVALTDIADADGYDFGVTAANQATLSVPTVAAGATVVLIYQVTIQ